MSTIPTCRKLFLGVAMTCSASMLAAGAAVAEETPYTVKDGKVDEATFNGWKTYKRQRCETCHGQTGEGGAAFPNLLTSLKTLTKDQFKEVVLEGRKNMPPHKNNKAVVENIDGLYAYLKGRSDGAIPPTDLEKIQ
jgi:mono/diheme cytochrome c family protein